MRRSLPVAVLLTAPVALAACGSSSHKTLAKADWVAKADAACTKGNQMRKAGGSPPNFDPRKATPAQLKTAVKFLDADLGATKYEVSAIDDLPDPKGAKPQADKLLARLEGTLIPDEQKLVDAARAGDKAAFSAAIALLDKDGPALQPLEKPFGFKVCGSGQ